MTSNPIDRAVPATVLTAASSDSAFRSGSLILAISSTCFAVTVPTLFLFGSADPFAMFAARFSSTAAGGVFVMNEYDRSAYTVTTTGMISPSSLAVFELKFLQKSMMLMPCGPSAVPTGGAGVALPAAIWSFTIAWTFFAIAVLYNLNLLDLQEIQFDRRRPAEDRHHDLQRVLVEIHFVDHAVEAGERPFVDPHLLALLEHVLRLRLFGRRPYLQENLLDFVLAERRRLRAGPDEAGDLRRVLHHVPRVVGHVHLDQDVAGEEPLRRHHLLAAAHFDDVLSRNQHLADVLLQPVRLDAFGQRLGHLLLEARVGVDDVPILLSVVGHYAAPNLRKIHCTVPKRIWSSANRYTPKNSDVRMTTTVVAYTAFCDGQVTRFSSLRTSLRNNRARSMRPPVASLIVSSVVVGSAITSCF